MDIDSSNDAQEIDDVVSEHNLHTTSTEKDIYADEDKMEQRVPKNYDDNGGYAFRVSDIMELEETNERVNVPSDGNIRRLNLHDCALFLARDRARKQLNSQKKSEIISDIIDDKRNFRPRVNINTNNNSTQAATPRDDGEELNRWSQREAYNASQRIEKQKHAF